MGIIEAGRKTIETITIPIRHWKVSAGFILALLAAPHAIDYNEGKPEGCIINDATHGTLEDALKVFGVTCKPTRLSTTSSSNELPSKPMEYPSPGLVSLISSACTPEQATIIIDYLKLHRTDALHGYTSEAQFAYLKNACIGTQTETANNR